MRVVTAVSTGLLLASAISPAAQPSPGKEAIEHILTSAEGWIVLAEFTQGASPTEKATRLGWRFCQEGQLVKGRTTGMAEEYNCDFDIVIRDDGFEFSTRARWCAAGTVTVMTPLLYDASDKTYPFKNLSTPLKWWLAPKP